VGTRTHSRLRLSLRANDQRRANAGTPSTPSAATCVALRSRSFVQSSLRTAHRPRCHSADVTGRQLTRTAHRHTSTSTPCSARRCPPDQHATSLPKSSQRPWTPGSAASATHRRSRLWKRRRHPTSQPCDQLRSQRSPNKAPPSLQQRCTLTAALAPRPLSSNPSSRRSSRPTPSPGCSLAPPSSLT